MRPTTFAVLAMLGLACSSPPSSKPSSLATAPPSPAPPSTPTATAPAGSDERCTSGESLVEQSDRIDAEIDQKQAEFDAMTQSDADEAGAKPAKPAKLAVCALAGPNLRRDEAEILAAAPPAPVRATPWNRTSRPQRMDLVQRRFELARPELDAINKQGFAVLGRLELPTYSHGYHEIFQSQLPVYITADSIFHAIFASHDSIVEQLEESRLSLLLRDALDQLHCALPAAAAAYPPEVARDLDLYLTVARTLAGGEPIGSKLGDPAIDRDAAALVEQIDAAAALAEVTLFGRPRAIDFTQYGPRGHYTKSDELQRFFRAAMWTSRLEFNLVSRSSRSSTPGTELDPRETPREAIAALALADLAAQSGAGKTIDQIDQAWGVLAGRREDVSIAQLGALRQKAQLRALTDAGAFAALKQAIGAGFARTTRIHPMPEGAKDLPVITTLIGPRIVADAQAIMPLVASAVPNRHSLAIADVAYTMGLDHAKQHLGHELARFPTLERQLEAGRKVVAAAPLGDDLYGAWWSAVRALAAPPAGVLPSFATTPAGRDLRMNTIAAAYGQLKHNYVLMAGQPYSEFGCEIPDGYVEPVPAAYRALEEYATRAAKLAPVLDPKGRHGVAAHFARVAQVMRVLRAISEHELAGSPLTATEKRWIGMVAELSIDTSQDITGHPPVYSGWYFDLFYEREADGMREASFIADYFTSQEGIAYVGATAPRMGVFVVDTNGPPRAFVGPVARAYEVRGPLATRYTDESAKTLPHVDEPWAASYTLAAPAVAPSIRVAYDPQRGVVIEAAAALGTATVKILDHHRVPLAARTARIAAGETVIPLRSRKQVGAVYIELGKYRGWVVADSYGQINAQLGPPPPPDAE
ncbi:MAG TPA: DUF3160 domain-containing protein [Kofleriaceae bacterium]|nr:DUF3160 domain-containing protein [Kofleriaceae bacterium]